MDVNLATTPRDPYLAYDVREAVRAARLCVECPYPAPCMQVCSQGVNIPKVMYWVGLRACERLPLSRWLMDEETVEAARTTDQICDCYN